MNRPLVRLDHSEICRGNTNMHQKAMNEIILAIIVGGISDFLD